MSLVEKNMGPGYKTSKYGIYGKKTTNYTKIAEDFKHTGQTHKLPLTKNQYCLTYNSQAFVI